MTLAEFKKHDSQAEAKRNVVAAIESVSRQLGNTPAICRKCYVHPEILNAYMSGDLVKMIEAKIAQKFKRQYARLTSDEIMVLAFLRKRLDSIKALAQPDVPAPHACVLAPTVPHEAFALALSRATRRRSRRSRRRLARSAGCRSRGTGVGEDTIVCSTESAWIGSFAAGRASMNSSTVRPLDVICQPPLMRSTNPHVEIRDPCREPPDPPSRVRWSPKWPCRA